MATTTADISQLLPRPTRRARVERHVRQNALAYALILPSLVFIAAIELYPLARGLLEGFKYHNRVQPFLTRFNGIDNYREAYHDPDVRSALRVSTVMVVAIVAGSYLLGLVAALVLHSKIRFGGIYRTMILIPWVIPPVVAYISWQWMLSDQGGAIDEILMRLHLVDKPILFLANSKWALFSLILVGIWSRVGFMMITVLAALSAIPDDLHEAAAIDGASRWSTFRHITLPLILPVSIIATLLQAIWTFNDFALPFVLTGGGPANATTTISLLSYREAFQRFNIGYGTSLAVISTVLMLLLGAVYLRLQAQRNRYETGGV
jgi:multiple sugar transport system permease protein